MSVEENKIIVRRLYEEAWNSRDLSVVDEIFAPNHVHHDPSNPVDIKGPEGTQQRITEVIATFPDIRFIIEDMIAEGNKVAVRSTVRGTHKGEFMGEPLRRSYLWPAR